VIPARCPELRGRCTRELYAVQYKLYDVQSVEHLPDGFIAAGFSNGGGMSELAGRRAGPDPLRAGRSVPHAGVDRLGRGGDARRRRDARGVRLPGSGHLFTDASLPDEYDAASAALLFDRVLEFCAAHGPDTA
jgi:hypothetical protein